jgi:hypothetical protein
MAGYSGTALVEKLGIKPGARLAFVDAPPGFERLLGTLPAGARKAASAQMDFSIVFVTSAAALNKSFARLASRTAPAGMLWVAWPKKAAKVQTDLTEDVVRRIGLAAGMVDVKVCAIDETWSGLKFVFRLKDRGATSPRPSSPHAARKAGKRQIGA